MVSEACNLISIMHMFTVLKLKLIMLFCIINYKFDSFTVCIKEFFMHAKTANA